MADTNDEQKPEDTLQGNTGEDTLKPTGEDSLPAGGDDTVDGNTGEDTLKPDDNTVVEPWADAGTVGGNDTLTYLQGTGISQEDAKALLFEAVQTQDLSKIDKEKLAEKVGGEAAANIIMRGMQSHIDELKAKAAEVLGILDAEVGGNANWQKIRTWAHGKLTKAEIAEYIGMIDKGGRFAKLAAKDLKERYVADGNSDPQNKEVTPNANGQGKVDNNTQPLSRREYFETLERHQRKGTLTPEVRQTLLKRRQAK